jgi:NAD(P)-dependent dehydrogenase (short-subunit alcohol dehydrogenase family)
MGLRSPPPLGTAMLPKDTYAGQVVLITGGGTGIGKGIALEFGRVGASVAILSRKQEHLDAGVKALEEIGVTAFGIACDIRDPVAIERSFEAIEARLGAVSVLVNNAAGNFPAPAELISPNGWRAITQIVLDGTFFCSTEFARRCMARGDGGAILNIAATYAWTGGPGTTPSAAAKAGVVNMTQSLAVEWAPDDIRVNGIAPGRYEHDDMPKEMLEGQILPAAKTIPAQRTGETRELGWAATYMCSRYAAYLTGHTLVLDGANWLRRTGTMMPEFVPIREQFGGQRKPR